MQSSTQFALPHAAKHRQVPINPAHTLPKIVRVLAVATLLGTLLSACGQKGDLYLPDVPATLPAAESAATP